MVLAISFLEAPLKFRAPGLELRVGLAVGKIVFRALNLAELTWSFVLVVCLSVDQPPARTVASAAIVGVLLLVQLALVRPALNRRSDRVLAGETVPRSWDHHAYIVLEILKVAALIALGCFLLAALFGTSRP
jgi:hypothetical protein